MPESHIFPLSQTWFVCLILEKTSEQLESECLERAVENTNNLLGLQRKMLVSASCKVLHVSLSFTTPKLSNVTNVTKLSPCYYLSK